MDICGYIYLYDIITNRQDVMKICVYNCKSVSHISPSSRCSEFLVDIVSRKILSPSPDFSLISYSMLSELVSTAICFDKKCEYPSFCEFNLDLSGNPYLRLCNTSKEVFPVPHNTYKYLSPRIFINISDRLINAEYTSVLKSSLYSHHLNFLALRCGILNEIIFYSLCGRIFMNLTPFISKRQTHKVISDSLNSGKYLMGILSSFPSTLKVKRRKISLATPFENDEYSNPFHKIIADGVKSLPEDDLFSVITSPCLLNRIVNDEAERFMPYLENLLWQNVIKSINDFEFVSCNDLLCFHFTDGRDMIKNHITNNRKFFNYHKSKNIRGILSTGEIIYNK